MGLGDIGRETPDCSVINIAHNQHLISTLDFFYPLVDDPYLQGRIGACNVLSDLYAMGITRIDTILMVLGVSSKMTEEQQEIVTSQMIKGFDDCAKEAKTCVTGGQSVINPYPMIGGCAIATGGVNEFIMPNGAMKGDKLLLTKPLGA